MSLIALFFSFDVVVSVFFDICWRGCSRVLEGFGCLLGSGSSVLSFIFDLGIFILVVCGFVRFSFVFV